MSLITSSPIEYTNFYSLKEPIQKIYNFKAKEEREIIYAIQIKNENEINHQNTRSSEITTNELKTSRLSSFRKTSIFLHANISIVLINRNNQKFYLEIIKIINLNFDISFIYTTDIENITKITYTKEEENFELNIFTTREHKLNFLTELNLNEFSWCLLHLFDYLKISNKISIKNLNYKDLDTYAKKENFPLINPIFKNVLKKKLKFEIEATDEELNSLHSTLKNLGIDSILNYNMEKLNNRIDQFSIEKKEQFLKLLNEDFKSSINQFLFQLSDLDDKVQKLNISNINDTERIDKLYFSIQKIEDKNHKIELRNINKQKLESYMKNLLNQLTITPQRKEILLHNDYTSNSDFVIVNEVLDNFVKFYKNREKQNIDMNIIKEGEEIIKGIIYGLISNFNRAVREYMKSNSFYECNFFREFPTFKLNEINKEIKELDLETHNKNKVSLKNYLLDRKFLIQKINMLFNGQEDLNHEKAFNELKESFCKGMRDNFINEFNKIINLWEVFFESPFLNEEENNLYLDSETFLEYNAFDNLYSEPMYEANKFFSCLILNTFFNLDILIDNLLLYFNESPIFYIEKNSEIYFECEKIICGKVYDNMTKNFENSKNKSILLAFIIYSILSAIQEKISSNVLGDFIQISLSDIFEIYKNEDEATHLEKTISDDDDSNLYDLEDVGFFKISAQETKNFIDKNMNDLKENINNFLDEQKEIISNFKCDNRRIGIIPIVKKTINFIKLLLAITNGIKNDFIFDVFEEFKIKLKNQIEIIANSNKKYTNIVLAENYHFIFFFFKKLYKSGINVDNPKFVEFEKEFENLYLKYKHDYIIEIFDYQFHDFYTYFTNFQNQFKLNTSQIKMQSDFTSNNFERKIKNFFNNIPKNIDKMAKRVIKHYTKEEGLCPVMWREEIEFWTEILNDIEKYGNEAYGKDFKVSEYINMLNEYDFKSEYMKKQ